MSHTDIPAKSPIPAKLPHLYNALYNSTRANEMYTQIQISGIEKELSLCSSKENFLIEKIGEHKNNEKIVSHCINLIETYIEDISKENLDSLVSLTPMSKNVFKKELFNFFVRRAKSGDEYAMSCIIDLLEHGIGNNLKNIYKLEKMANENNFDDNIKLKLKAIEEQQTKKIKQKEQNELKKLFKQTNGDSRRILPAVKKQKALKELKNRFSQANNNFSQMLQNKPQQVWR